MNDQPEKLDLTSLDIAAEQREKLKAAFPEVFTEGGKIDFERLKMTLGEMVDSGKERYGMNWPGKAECFRTIQTPSRASLRPCREESVNFDTTENLIIEGDNLEVLKLLQKGYLGKVKMIYIDPPYNTGSDFIYPDNYSEDLETYLSYTGQVDAEGKKFSTNTETDGRFHSKWMNMMYPRLFLARNLLKNDGLIFISIDDNEAENLRKICNEIFGEENFIDTIIWKKRYGGGAKEKYLVTLHEYILVYARSKNDIENIYVPLTQASIDRYYKNKDEYFEKRGAFRTHPLESMKSFEDRPNLKFSIKAPDGTEVYPKRQWRWSKETVQDKLSTGHIHFSKDKEGSWSLSSKQYLQDEDGQRETKFFSVIDDVYSQHGTNETIDIFGDAQIFPFAKPSKLLEKLLQVGTISDENDVVLDFFAGSGTTAHSVENLNNEDGGNRRYILIQLPEPTEQKDFPNISDITKERVRRVINKLNIEDEGKLDLESSKKLDRGFRAFKLDTSNFTPWDGNQPDDVAAVAKQLDLHVEHILTGRTQEDILTELLLKSGFPLSTKVEQIELAGKKVFSVEEGAMLVCLEEELTNEVIKAMAEKKPSRVICLDAGFHGNDQLKTNAVQTMKARGVTSFRTV